MHFITNEDVQARFSQPVTPSKWSAVIPAAGKGTRLGYDKPKILYPIAGRPILEWLITLLEPRCSRLIFSVSPTGAPQVKPEIESRLSGKYDMAVLDSRGMADSIYAAVAFVATPYLVVIWGDQVGIHPDTLDAIMRIIEHGPETHMAFPIIERAEPYVHYDTDSSGTFVCVLEQREGAVMPDMGRSDCGLFAFKTEALTQLFQNEVEQGITLSKGTNEWNFLPMLPGLDTGEERVIATRLGDVEESIGVNDAKDAAKLEAYLKKRNSE